MGLMKIEGFDDDVDVDSMLSNLSRLNAVQDTGLEFNRPQSTFDELTRLASLELNAPSATMSLVDDRRQMFISDYGLDGANTELGEEPLEYSYCKFVVALKEPLVVSDAETNEYVKDSKSTTEKGYRAYLGVPLVFNGEVVGSFCVHSKSPRTWTDDDLRKLQAIAATAMERMESRPKPFQLG